MAWQSQQYQGQEGQRRVPDPPSTQPLRRAQQNTTYDLSWDNEDTQPGIGPVTQTETSMFPPYTKPEPKEVERTGKLFVFGVCRRGFSLNVAVARDKGFIGAAKTLPHFKMINVGDEIPVIVTGGTTAIVGEVYMVENRTIDWLDKIEDCPSAQARRIISLEDGTRAHCYILNQWKVPYREEVIPSGDWAEWKRTERARKADRKRHFLEKMKKGKEEAEARRKALSEALNTPGEFSSEYGSRLWDPANQKWRYVPAGQSVQVGHTSSSQVVSISDNSRTTYKDRSSGKSMVHISDVPMTSLRIRLRDGGHDPDGMTDSLVRIECMTRYGMWYEVE